MHVCFLAIMLLLAHRVDADCIFNKMKERYECAGGFERDLDKIPNNATSILIDHMRVYRINETMFERFADTLRELHCRCCWLTDIHDNAFSKLTKLEHLRLPGNNLTRVRAAWFKHTIAIRILSFTNNEIGQIDDKAFSELTGLENLRLAMNNLTRVNHVWFKNTISLKILLLHSNKIAEIDNTAFSKLAMLEDLRLGNNSLTRVNAEWLNSTVSLRTLVLRFNNIYEIDDNTFSKLAYSYSQVDLVGNNLREVKAKWFGDTAIPLWSLLLSDNKIGNIEDNAFSNLTTLDTLYLDVNNLTKVDAEWFGETVPMRGLYLNDNQIDEFDGKVIDRATNLKCLDVSRNKLDCANIENIIERRQNFGFTINGNSYLGCKDEIKILAGKNNIRLKMD